MPLIDFILPIQAGSMTVDGSLLIALGCLFVVGYIFMNRENISLKEDNENTSNTCVSNAVEIKRTTKTPQTQDVIRAKEDVSDEDMIVEKAKIENRL